MLYNEIKQKVTVLEKNDKSLFLKFMSMGMSLIDLAAKDNIQDFSKIYKELKDDKELSSIMQWHENRAFKEAIKYKSVNIIQSMIEQGIDLRQECFN